MNMQSNKMPKHHKKNMHKLCQKLMNQQVHVEMVDGVSFVAQIDHLEADNVYVTILNLDGMHGMQGMPGSQHMPGSQGMAGSQGMSGMHEMPGMQGMPGMQSPQGMQGAQGMQDMPSMQHSQGSQGMQREDEDERVWGYPGYGYGFPGYGYPGYGYGYGYGYGGIGRFILPLAAIAALSLGY